MLLEQATLEESIHNVLSAQVAAVNRDGDRNWGIQLGCEGAHAGTVSIDGDWLIVRVPVSGRRTPRCLGQEYLSGLLRFSGLLPAGVKYVLEGSTPGLSVAFDLRMPHESSTLPDGADRFAEQLASGLAGVEQAFALLKGGAEFGEQAGVPSEPTSETTSAGSGTDQDTNTDADQAAGTDSESWQKLVETAGWPNTVRASGRIGIPLETSTEHVQAVLEPLPGDAARVSFECATGNVTGDIGQHALAVMLLTVAGAVRWTRPVTEPDAADGPPHCGWEVALSPGADEVDMQQALSVLSIAAVMTARESRLFAEESVARSYLEIRGWSP